MLKAISFDLWETLITDKPENLRRQERLRLTRIEAILGEDVSACPERSRRDRIERAYRSVWHRCQELYWSRDHDISCRRQIEHFLEDLGLDPASFDEPVLAEIEHAYANAAIEELPEPVDGAGETLAELKSRGFGIGLISNTGRTPGYALRQILAELGLAESIDVMVFSNEHGRCKPQTSIFEELRRGLGVAYEEMAFVGDNLYVDVHGAQRCGMRGIHFDPPARGSAIAPVVEHGLEIVPDSTVTSLRELLDFVGAPVVTMIDER